MSHLLLLLLLYCCAFNHCCRCCCCMNENVCKQKSGFSIHAFAFILLIRFVVLRWIAFVMFCCLSKHSFQCVFLFLCKKNEQNKYVTSVHFLPFIRQCGIGLPSSLQSDWLSKGWIMQKHNHNLNITYDRITYMGIKNIDYIERSRNPQFLVNVRRINNTRHL